MRVNAKGFENLEVFYHCNLHFKEDITNTLKIASAICTLFFVSTLFRNLYTKISLYYSLVTSKLKYASSFSRVVIVKPMVIQIYFL